MPDPIADAELPAELIDRLIESLLDATPAVRTELVAEWVEREPTHARAIHRFVDDLLGAERLLDRGFGGGEAALPSDIGGYRVLELLGQGAFGIVYLCQQERPVRRRVAVKLMRAGTGDRGTLARFEAERQVLAQLRHPAIAHVFDAGTVTDGRPFFVMEHVDGVPITRYCNEHGSSVEDRLRLFLELCRGVEHAHRAGIVHRDLKPANVLVVESEGRPLPKIIDFGIAKALQPTTEGLSELHTATGRVLGTPGYMSPEQAAGRTSEVDERADVYALGVMLYELLTGVRPFGRDEPSGDSTAPRPSLRVASQSRETGAGTEGTTRRQLVAQLRGDLDWIVLTALAFERERRYPSADALATDLARHLVGHPVSVGPPSWSYRVRKFARRHRAVVWAGVSVVVTIVAAIVWSGVRSAGLEREADLARSDANAALADTEHIADRLLARATDASLTSAPQHDALRASIVSDAIALYDRLADARPTDPSVLAGRCRASMALSRVHWLCGRSEDALRTAEFALVDAEAVRAATVRALETKLSVDPAARLEAEVESRGLLAEARRKRGVALGRLERWLDALADFELAVVDLDFCAGTKPSHFSLSCSAAWRELATSRQAVGQVDATIAASQRSIDVLEHALRLRPDHALTQRDLAYAHMAMGQICKDTRRFDLGKAAFAAAVNALASVPATDIETHCKIHAMSGMHAVEAGEPELAERELKLAIELGDRWLAASPGRWEPPLLLAQCTGALGRLYDGAGRFDVATPLLVRAIELRELSVAQNPTDTASRLHLHQHLCIVANMLWDRYRREDLAQAEVFAQRAVEVNAELRRAGGVDDLNPPWVSTVMLAQLQTSAGKPTAIRWDEVESQLEQGFVADLAGSATLAWIGVASNRLQQGRFADALAAIARARELAASDPRLARLRLEVEWWEAQLAFANGELERAIGLADVIHALRPTWYGTLRSAEVLDLASQRSTADAARARALATDAANRYRRVVHTLRIDIQESPRDPWFVLPFGFASIKLARIERELGDVDAARGLLLEALPLLEAVQPAALSDVWEEATVVRGRELLAQLQAEVR